MTESQGIERDAEQASGEARPLDETLVGRTIGHYEVLGRLGTGSMGVVYRASDRKLGRPVALKFLSADLASSERARTRFLREARAASTLDHPNVGTVYEIGEHEGRPFIALALYDGETLKERIARGPVPVREAVGILTEIARGLSAAHGAEIVHRDVKPANVIVTRAGAVKLLDFGLAKSPLDEAGAGGLTVRGTVLGTPAYMAPEQVRGEPADAQADLWALGAVAYELLAGVPAFTGTTREVIVRQIVGGEPRALVELCPDVPPALADLCAELLRKAPSDRVPSAALLERRLTRIAASLRSPASAAETVTAEAAGRPLAAASTRGPLREGQIVADRFRLIHELGRGGMGLVWRAHHLGLHVPCAVKFIHDESALSPELTGRFEREARAAAQLRSPHVVQLLDHGVWQDRPYIAMEYLEGEDLGSRIARKGRLGPAETVDIVAQVARGLGKAHSAGIVHRDLKPENVFLVPDDDGEVAKILDFGIAKSAAAALESPIGPNTNTGALLGTPLYMSPEQADGTLPVDLRSDLWSLAVITFRCMTGKLPFESSAVGDLLMKIMSKPIPVPSEIAPDLPPAFDAWWKRAASRDPDGRFQTARQLADALARAVGDAPAAHRSSMPSLEPSEPRSPDHDRAAAAVSTTHAGGARRPKRRSWALGAVVVALGVAAIAVAMRWRSVPVGSDVQASVIEPDAPALHSVGTPHTPGTDGILVGTAAPSVTVDVAAPSAASSPAPPSSASASAHRSERAPPQPPPRPTATSSAAAPPPTHVEEPTPNFDRRK